MYSDLTTDLTTNKNKTEVSDDTCVNRESTLQPSQAQVAPIVEANPNPSNQGKAKPKKESEPKQQKESSLHQRLMAHRHNRIGPSPNPKAEGSALQWLVKQVEKEIYTEQDCYDCMEYQLTAQEEKWRTEISWNTVVKSIGTWKQRKTSTGNGTKLNQKETKLDRTLANLEIAKQRFLAKQKDKNDG